jgi:surface antigen
MARLLDGKQPSNAKGDLVGRADSRRARIAEADHSCVGWTLGRVPSNVTVRWGNRREGVDYAVTPTRTYEAPNGDRCRDYVIDLAMRGERFEAENTACRGPDGAWKLGSPYEDMVIDPQRGPWAGWAGTPGKWPPPLEGPGM